MASPKETYCLCGQPYDIGQFMIECDCCREWFHGSCVDVKIYQSDDIDKYHCPKCSQTYGPSIFKIPTNSHRQDRYEVGAEDRATQVGSPAWLDMLYGKPPHARAPRSCVANIPGQAFTEEYVRDNGFNRPLLFPTTEGLDLQVPTPATFTVRSVLRHVGARYELEVIDSRRQANMRMALSDFVDYFETPPEQRDEKILNVLSLEFTDTPMSSLVRTPKLARRLDWASRAWPPSAPSPSASPSLAPLASRSAAPRPAVQKYCLMSAVGSYTDFHVDFGGTTVWYHVMHGRKIFYLVPPTATNLALYQQWCSSQTHGECFFGDLVEWYATAELAPGQTMFIPTGWIHAVATPEDSLVFGGNFLHSYGIELQLQINEIERRVETPTAFRYPLFEPMHWYAAIHLLQLLKRLNEERQDEDFQVRNGVQQKCDSKELPPHLVRGIRILTAALKEWHSLKASDASKRENVPKGVNSGMVVRELSRELRRLERYRPPTMHVEDKDRYGKANPVSPSKQLLEPRNRLKQHLQKAKKKLSPRQPHIIDNGGVVKQTIMIVDDNVHGYPATMTSYTQEIYHDEQYRLPDTDGPMYQEPSHLDPHSHHGHMEQQSHHSHIDQHGHLNQHGHQGHLDQRVHHHIDQHGHHGHVDQHAHLDQLGHLQHGALGQHHVEKKSGGSVLRIRLDNSPSPCDTDPPPPAYHLPEHSILKSHLISSHTEPSPSKHPTNQWTISKNNTAECEEQILFTNENLTVVPPPPLTTTNMGGALVLDGALQSYGAGMYSAEDLQVQQAEFGYSQVHKEADISFQPPPEFVYDTEPGYESQQRDVIVYQDCLDESEVNRHPGFVTQDSLAPGVMSSYSTPKLQKFTPGRSSQPPAYDVAISTHQYQSPAPAPSPLRPQPPRRSERPTRRRVSPTYHYEDGDGDGELFIDDSPQTNRRRKGPISNAKKKSPIKMRIPMHLYKTPAPQPALESAPRPALILDRLPPFQPANGIESLIQASVLTAGENVHTEDAAVAGMLSIAGKFSYSEPEPKLSLLGGHNNQRTFGLPSLNIHKVDGRRKKRSLTPMEIEDIETEESVIKEVHRDDEYIYPSLEYSSDEEEMEMSNSKSRRRRNANTDRNSKHDKDESWSPRARLGRLVPKLNRPARAGVKREAVRKALQAAAATLSTPSPALIPTLMPKPTPSPAPVPIHTPAPTLVPPPIPAVMKKQLVKKVPVKRKVPAKILSPAPAPLPLSLALNKGTTLAAKPKKGMKTAKQRLGKILKIHKMMY